MIIRAPRRPDTFYRLDRRIANDTRLSWIARGILIHLLTKPDNWQVSVAALIKQTADSRLPSGRDAVYAALKELAEVGYITRHQPRQDDGNFGPTQYFVRELDEAQMPPDTDEPDTVNPTPLPAEPYAIQSHAANPTQEKRDSKREEIVASSPSAVDKLLTACDAADAEAGSDVTAAVRARLRATRGPALESVAATIHRAALKMPGEPPATLAQVAQALEELAASDQPFSPALFRGYLRRVVAPPPPVPPSTRRAGPRDPHGPIDYSAAIAEAMANLPQRKARSA